MNGLNNICRCQTSIFFEKKIIGHIFFQSRQVLSGYQNLSVKSISKYLLLYCYCYGVKDLVLTKVKITSTPKNIPILTYFQI